MNNTTIRLESIRLGNEFYIPKHPTTGFMLTLLDKHGIHLRGTDEAKNESRKKLATRLQALGYDVTHEPHPLSKAPKVER